MGELAIVEGMVPIEQMKAQVQGIQALMKSVMRPTTKENPNGHYGLVPGCGDKPTLLKAGAEKLAFAFNLDLQTEIEVVDMGGMHREYRCTTTVYSKASGGRLGNGAGCATTLESKWRYRSENTGAMVPAEYWNTRDSELIGGSQFSPRKVDGKWFIFHKVDHDNPADYYNTCLKMAEKRSKVCAVLNVTAASDIFTQDIEEMGEVLGTQKTSTTATQKPDVKKTQSKKESGVKSGKAGKLPTDEVMTKIDRVTIETGTNEKTKTDWTKYIVHSVGGTEYGTFSETFAEQAKSIQGSDIEALIGYTIHDKFGNTIEIFEIQDA
jgi:hypothetical protein